MSEESQVAEATFASYYGRPILKATRWKEPHLPAYLFLGETSGAAAVLAAIAAATGQRRLARAGRLIAAASAAGGAAFLAAELGRPARFLNMLRVAKPTSPMSVGAWLLAAHSGLAGIAAASDLTGRAPAIGELAGEAAALTGPVLATYPGVLLANTAVPAWHGAYRELPLLFAGGAMTAAGAAALAATRGGPDGQAQAEPARRIALLGAVMESAAGYAIEHWLGPEGEPYREGGSGRMLRAARALTLAGAGAALTARRSRTGAAAAAALLAGGGLAAKFAVLRAGVASANDPRHVIAQQRAAMNGSAAQGRRTAWRV